MQGTFGHGISLRTPAGELNHRRVTAVEEAIKAIEAATDQPELRSIAPAVPADRSKP